ncbi:MAG: response regulator [Deltaproteobacteria bacterium]|nr:response regulator [Deltaproteobacteria bacterium]
MKKILVVDDDAALRKNITEVLNQAGYEHDEAGNGLEALEKAEATEYDVVLLDYLMPKMDGMEVLANLRKASPKSKIIIMTAFATIDGAVEAIKKGASHYLTKPFKIDEALAAIKRALEEATFEDGIKKLAMNTSLNALSNAIRRRIIAQLVERGKMRLMEIARELMITDHTKVIFHLRLLRDTGLIEQDAQKAYSLTREGEKLFECLKILENYLSTPE